MDSVASAGGCVCLRILFRFTGFLIKNLHPANYLQQWLFCLIAMVLLGVDVFLEVKADLVILSGEGRVLAIVQVTKEMFHKIKIGMGCTMVGIAALLSLIVFHHRVGVREGTVAAAILVGLIVKFCNRHFHLSMCSSD